MGNEFSTTSRMYETIYEIIFNKLHLSETELKSKLIFFIQECKEYCDSLIQTQFSKKGLDYIQQNRSYFKTVDNYISFQENLIEWNQIPIYYANLIIYYLIELRYIQLSSKMDKNWFEIDYLQLLSIIEPKQEDLNLIRRIQINENEKTVNVSIKYMPMEDLQSLSKTLDILEKELDKLSTDIVDPKEKKKKI